MDWISNRKGQGRESTQTIMVIFLIIIIVGLLIVMQLVFLMNMNSKVGKIFSETELDIEAYNALNSFLASENEDGIQYSVLIEELVSEGEIVQNGREPIRIGKGVYGRELLVYEGEEYMCEEPLILEMEEWMDHSIGSESYAFFIFREGDIMALQCPISYPSGEVETVITELPASEGRRIEVILAVW